jgi:hypothetical protein
MRSASTRADVERTPTSEEARLLVENKNIAIAVVVAFLLMVWLTNAGMIAAFGVVRLIAGTRWINWLL